MPWVAQQVARQGDAFRYLAKSISEFPTPPVLNQELQACGLKLLSTRSMSLGLVRLTVTQKPSPPARMNLYLGGMGIGPLPNQPLTYPSFASG